MANFKKSMSVARRPGDPLEFPLLKLLTSKIRSRISDPYRTRFYQVGTFSPRNDSAAVAPVCARSPQLLRRRAASNDPCATYRSIWKPARTHRNIADIHRDSFDNVYPSQRTNSSIGATPNAKSAMETIKMDAQITTPESGLPADDLRAYRRCLGQFATGITVVTAETSTGRVGNTANSFSSISLDPPLISWALAKSSRSFSAFKMAEHFAVNVLGGHQIPISQRFSSTEDDKFKSVSWSAGRNGAPVIDTAIAVLECRTENVYECGDHILIVGQVTRFTRGDGKPLLYVQGYYGLPEQHPDLKPARDANAAVETGVSESHSLATLLFKAHHLLSARFEEHRQAEGISVSHARVLVSLRGRDIKSAETIIREMYLPRPDAMDAISDLLDRGYVERVATNELRLTDKGQKLQETLQSRLREFEAVQTKGIPDDELHCARQVLTKLLAAK
ncbi:flavin reductase [Paraburkholderia sp. MM5477-R1]|uniref:flavin reductase n=1 Tax=Paraburkholderia sp. MM5477-R1 TaxID=2991062 RepID=UPI003D1BBD3D